MRERAEDESRFTEWSVLACNECQVFATDVRGLPALTVSGRESQIHVRMTGDEQTELASRVPAGAKDADRKFMHT